MAAPPPRHSGKIHSVPDLDQWRSAIQDGEPLLAAAPMCGEWRGPDATGWSWRSLLLGVLAGLVTFAVSVTPSAVRWALLLYLVAGVICLIRSRRWRSVHPCPTGMAAVLDRWRGRGPVLLITASGVLATGLRSGPTGRVQPTGPAEDLPGLVAVDADGERLVLRFEDGPSGSLWQRWPTPGAAARVAELAASVLPRRPSHNSVARSTL